MSGDSRQHTRPGDPCAPAPQPNPPSGNCNPLPAPPAAPPLPDPAPCELDCECAEPPKPSATCLDELIAGEGRVIKEAERAQKFKEALEALLAKTESVTREYTHEKRDALVREWKKQDGQIVELIKKLICALPCWRCMIECLVCVPVYAIRDLERRLNGRGVPFAPADPVPYAKADSLHDLKYWHQRNRDTRQAVLERAKNALAAWETPVQTIEKALADDAKIILDAQNVLAPSAAKLLYDVFFVLIPRHLAIAPPRDDNDESTQTRIERQYAAFCPCDKDDPDQCCGLDTGEMSLRERLIGPLPYLIAPQAYLDLVCCLVKNRYQPAKDALATAEADLAAAEALIASTAAAIDAQIKALETSAKEKLVQYECDPPDDDGDCGCHPRGSRSSTPAVS